MRVGSLFAGIGGFDLAARWMGWHTRWYSEIEPYACRVMEKNFPDAINLGDITRINNPPPVDILCGGFPCQDISLAGKGAGIEGARSGLWSHYARLVGEIRPRWVLAENVSALRSRGLDRVLQDLHALGYDAEWHCVPASYVGAPHRRDRIWIVAFPAGSVDGGLLGNPGGEPLDRVQHEGGDEGGREAVPERPLDPCHSGCGDHVAHPHGHARQGRSGKDTDSEGWRASAAEQSDVRREGKPRPCHAGQGGALVAHPDSTRLALGQGFRGDDGSQLPAPLGDGWWTSEPDVGRVANGVPARVDRLRCLGNAIVPQVASLFFQAIQRQESER